MQLPHQRVDSLQESGNSSISKIRKTISYFLRRSRKLCLSPVNFPKGFTLIELLVAISVIAIISTIGITSYSQAQIRARDAKRKKDLGSIAIALQLYYTKYGKYPAIYPNLPDAYSDTNTRWHYLCSTWGGDQWFPELILGGFITKLPIDPINTGVPWDDNGYGYCYGNPINNGQTYSLSAQLENKDDPDRCGVKRWKRLAGENWCAGEPPKYGSFHSNFLFEASPDR